MGHPRGPPRPGRGHAPPPRGLSPAPDRRRRSPVTGAGGHAHRRRPWVGRRRQHPRRRPFPRAGPRRPAPVRRLRAPLRPGPPVRAGHDPRVLRPGRGRGARRRAHRRATTSWSGPTRTSRLRRDVRLEHGPTVRVEKRFTFAGDRREPNLGLEVSVENCSTSPVRFDLAVEWAIMLLGGGGNPAAYYEVGGERQAHDGAGELAGARSSAAGTRTSASISPRRSTRRPTAWWTPIETVSNSEYGFERIYQGSALVGVWPWSWRPANAARSASASR